MEHELKKLPLELQLEISKQLASMRDDLTKYVQNGHAVIESYEKANVDLHWNGLVANVEIGLEDEATMPACRFLGFWTSRHRHSGLMPTDSQIPVLVWVGIGSEPFRPIDSVIRLQSLDGCRMRVVDELEIGFAPYPKSVLRVLNWELGTVPLAA